MTLNEAIKTMTDEIVSILADNKPTIYLFGSVVLDDFRLGWSDIDIAVLTEREITEQQADILVGLRQAMLERYPGNPYYRDEFAANPRLYRFLLHQPRCSARWVKCADV